MKLAGHRRIREDLARALVTDRLPGSLLLHGPIGIGKQRLGLWLAQRILCQAAGSDVEPCGTCTPCRLAARLEHPDIHWFFPVANVSGSREKKVELFEAARAEELEARRAFRWTRPEGMVGYYLDQVTSLRRLADKRPGMGNRKVFVVGEAERLVSQEASQEAANALLKLLEEPPADTTFILTATDPELLLPTIRSRLLPIRVDPLDHDELVALLTDQLGVDTGRADVLARVARGAPGTALELAAGEDGAPFARQREQARALLEAVAAPRPVELVAAAHATGVGQARGEFTAVLQALQVWVRDAAALAAGAPELVVNADAIDWLRSAQARMPGAAAGAPRALDAIARALALAAGNVNPQLILADLLPSLRRTLTRPAFSA